MPDWKNPIRLEHTHMPRSDERHIYLPPTEPGGPHGVQFLSQPSSIDSPDGVLSKPSLHPTRNEANVRVDELKKRLEAVDFRFGPTEERP
jgi:hypothetical protein